MKNKKINALLGLVLCANMLSAQNANPVEIKSPNAATLGLFGDIPVSFYTGTPDISIPIYTIKNGNIEMPITLRYHPAAVKPNEHPGWVGLGWDLQCGGCISRVINGYLDEMDHKKTNNNPEHWKKKSYYQEGAKLLYGTSNWNTAEFAYKYFPKILFSNWDDVFNLSAQAEPLLQNGPDLQADIFYFNFGNHSGRFVWDGSSWIVDSEENITVEENGFFERNPSILSGAGFFNNSRQFKQFILKMEDGTKYYFGGDASSVEWVGPIYDEQDKHLNISSWYLTKIEDIHGNKVSFLYDRVKVNNIYNEPVFAANAKFSFYWYDISIYDKKGNNIARPTDSDIANRYNNIRKDVTTSAHNGYIIFPTYLKEIDYKETRIVFNKKNTVEKAYSDDYLSYVYLRRDPVRHDPPAPNKDLYENRLVWQQLQSISIILRDKSSTFTFSYSSNENQRLTLNSLKTPTSEKYTFEYNNIAGLPDYGGNYCDHWGYYNGKTIEGKKDDIWKNRESDHSTVTIGLLTKMIYPTGGYTKFEWEANVANRVYKKAGNTVKSYSTPKTVGGARIKTIMDLDNRNVLRNQRTYTYTDGILNGEPVYSRNERGDSGNEYVADVDFNEVDNLISYNANAHGSHIGYSKVVETNYDGSSTTYQYTNYTAHKDQSGGQFGWSLFKDAVYAPYVSLERERGKLTNQIKKDSGGNITESINYQYRKGTDNTIRRYHIYGKNGVYFYMSALSDHTYRYSVSGKTTTKYANGKSLSTAETYAYNKRDKVKTYTFDSNGEKYTTETRYVYDYIDEMINTYGSSKLISLRLLSSMGILPNVSATSISTDEYTQSFWKLWGKGLHDFPIDVIQKKGSDVVGGNLYVYKSNPLNSKAIVLAKVCDLRTASPITTAVKNTIKIEPVQFTPHSKFITATIFDSYDSNGNLLQYHNDNGKDITMKYDKSGNCIARIENAKDGETYFNSFEGKQYYAPVHCGDSSACGVVSSAKLSLASLVSPSYTASYWFQGASSQLAIVAFDKDMKELGVVTSVSNSLGSTSTWTYIECVFNKALTQKYPNCAYICVRNNTSNIYVDDMRFLPTDASMTTYTYDRYGITSITDENDVSTYYYYDRMGRLTRIEDADHNYVKCYEYNYINK